MASNAQTGDPKIFDAIGQGQIVYNSDSTWTTHVSVPDVEALKQAFEEFKKANQAISVPPAGEAACAVCGQENKDGMIFEGKVRVCTGCLIRLLVWAGKKSMDEPKSQDRMGTSSEKKRCARCERSFPLHCLWLMGDKGGILLCDPCREASLEEVIEKSKPPRRLLL